MLSVFVPTASALKKLDNVEADALPPNAIWIDMKSPSPGEDKAVEKLVGIEIPTREDMQEIEISSRLYVENGARYMTATLMCAADSQAPRTTPVT
ncbi:MAG TPA: magnesium transporter, partial [Afipia sp.]